MGWKLSFGNSWVETSTHKKLKGFSPLAKLSLALLGTSAVLQGCSSSSKKHEVTAHRSTTVESFEIQGSSSGQIDLVSMIDPENRRGKLPGGACQQPSKKLKKQARLAWEAKDLSCAFEAFETYYMTWPEFEAYLTEVGSVGKGADEHYQKAVNSLALAVRRNKIQDRIMTRSDNLCNNFQRRLGISLAFDNNTDEDKWFGMRQERVVKSVGGLVANGDALLALTNATGITKKDRSAFDEEVIEKSLIRIANEGITLARADLKNEVNQSRFFVRGEGEGNLTGPDYGNVYSRNDTGYERVRSSTAQLPRSRPKPASSNSKANYNFNFVALEEFSGYDNIDLESSNLQLITEQEVRAPVVQAPARDEQAELSVGIMSIAAYSLEQALGDGVAYHNSCSVRKGLSYSSRALSEMQKSMKSSTR